MDETTRHAAVDRIRSDMDRLGWSQRDLADKALVGESTVFRLLKGEFTTKTLRKVERALGIDPMDAKVLAGAFARIEYGGYARELYAYYEQDYVCVRPAFADPEQLMVYPLNIAWSGDTGGLVFSDHNPGYEQSGVVTVPTGTQFLHFVTLDKGSARLITAYHMPENDMVIRGMVMTFANPKGRTLQPAASPIVMFPLDDEDGGQAVQALRGFSGLIAKDDPRAEAAVAYLAKLECEPIFLEG